MTDYKKDFPLLAESDIAYLDNAATEQRPACVLDAEREFYERWNANPLRGLYELGVEATEQYEHARERVARFVHAKSEKYDRGHQPGGVQLCAAPVKAWG